MHFCVIKTALSESLSFAVTSFLPGPLHCLKCSYYFPLIAPCVSLGKMLLTATTDTDFGKLRKFPELSFSQSFLGGVSHAPALTFPSLAVLL